LLHEEKVKEEKRWEQKGMTFFMERFRCLLLIGFSTYGKEPPTSSNTSGNSSLSLLETRISSEAAVEDDDDRRQEQTLPILDLYILLFLLTLIKPIKIERVKINRNQKQVDGRKPSTTMEGERKIATNERARPTHTRKDML